jgi:2-hydroxychromene-2-carboxylate isomerase
VNVAIEVIQFSDPGCPWAYSANPAFSVLRWRYGDQLRWRLVVIGLSEAAGQYEAQGYTPGRVAQGYRQFRRLGMPFAPEVRSHVPSTGRACRAVVATRLMRPEREWAAFRTLQTAWFTTALPMDEDESIALVLRGVAGLDSEAVMAALDSENVETAYQADRAEARTAAGSPTEFQRKARVTDGVVRYTAPSLILASGERRLEAGGFQPVQAYDVLIANLDPTLERRPPASDPEEVLAAFPEGLSTQEIAAIMTADNDPVDRNRAEEALIELVAQNRARRTPAGNDALWEAPSEERSPIAAAALAGSAARE